MKFEWEVEGKTAIITIGKQQFKVQEGKYNGPPSLQVTGYSFPNCLQIEPQCNNVVELRVRELK